MRCNSQTCFRSFGISTGIVLLTVFCNLQTIAQDISISQTYAAPLLLNPALTGGYNGNFRIATLYRDQWSSMLGGDPYRSFMLSGDARMDVGNSRVNGDNIGVGVSIVSDRVSPFDFSTNSIMLNVAYHKRLGRGKVNFLSAGLQFGLAQKNFSYENFTFQDQFNGIDNFPFATAEDFPANNYGHFDLSLGINYATEVNRNLSIEFGGAGFHLLEPNISFYKDVDVSMSNLINQNGLKSRYVGHVSAHVIKNNEVSFTPRIIYSTQGTHQQIMFGSGARSVFNDVKELALHAGAWGRMASELDSYGFRDVVLMVGFEFQAVIVGFSYDLSVNDLTTYQVGQHSFEFSLRYTGNYEDEGNFCPQF